MSSLKRLIVNADDFGFTRDVSEGILEAHTNGILTSASLMANGDAFDYAVSLARKCPTLDIGCHLTLVSGCSLLPPYRPLPATVPAFVKALVSGSFQLREELEAQINRILDTGISVTHLDTHKHIHLLSPVLKVVAKIAQQHGIPWVRSPFDLSLAALDKAVPLRQRVASLALNPLKKKFKDILQRYNCRTPEHFVGFQLTGRLGPQELHMLIRNLPSGTTELMCHPGFLTEELRNAHTRLRESRWRELEALTKPEAKVALLESGVEVVSYRDL